MTGKDVKEKLDALGEGESLVIDGEEWTCIGADFFLEEQGVAVTREELPGEFVDDVEYEVSYF